MPLWISLCPQVTALLRLQAPEAVAGVGEDLEDAMETAWATAQEREKRTTKRQAAVSRTFDSLQVR